MKRLFSDEDDVIIKIIDNNRASHNNNKLKTPKELYKVNAFTKFKIEDKTINIYIGLDLEIWYKDSNIGMGYLDGSYYKTRGFIKLKNLYKAITDKRSMYSILKNIYNSIEEVYNANEISDNLYCERILERVISESIKYIGKGGELIGKPI